MNVEKIKRDIRGLILIIEKNKKNDYAIGREYVIEKLNMILSGGIGFHPSIEKKLNAIEKQVK